MHEKYGRRTSKQSVRGSNPCRRASFQDATYKIMWHPVYVLTPDLACGARFPYFSPPKTTGERPLPLKNKAQTRQKSPLDGRSPSAHTHSHHR